MIPPDRLIRNALFCCAAMILACVVALPNFMVGEGSAYAADDPHFIDGRSQAETAFQKRISMGSGKSAIIDLPRDVAEIVIGNPKVVDAVVRTPRKIYVIGGEAGQSTIIGLDSKGVRSRVSRSASAGMSDSSMPFCASRYQTPGSRRRRSTTRSFSPEWPSPPGKRSGQSISPRVS